MWSERIRDFIKLYNIYDCRYEARVCEEPRVDMAIGLADLLRIIDDAERSPKYNNVGLVLENFTREELESLNQKITKHLDDLNYQNIIGF